jgi:hypothetical protein
MVKDEWNKRKRKLKGLSRMKNEQSRNTGNKGHTRHMTKTKKTTTHKTKKMSNKRKNPTKYVGEPRYSRRVNSSYLLSLVATSADSIPSSYLVRITIAPIGTTFGNLQ